MTGAKDEKNNFEKTPIYIDNKDAIDNYVKKKRTITGLIVGAAGVGVAALVGTLMYQAGKKKGEMY